MRVYKCVSILKLLQLSWVLNSLTTAHLGPLRGRLAARHLRLEPMLASPNSGFFDSVARSVSNEVATHRARLTDAVVPASDSLELDHQSIVEQLQANEGGVECLQLAHRHLEPLLICLWCQ